MEIGYDAGTTYGTWFLRLISPVSKRNQLFSAALPASRMD
jgi:hypothetical protein